MSEQVPEDIPRPPLLRVVAGDPTPDELAALVCVLTAVAGGVRAAAPRRPASWRDRQASFRGPLHPRLGAWRTSGFRAGARTRAAW